MFYTIYQIYHPSSGKAYIGKHKTSNLDDGYMGSGKYLRSAIDKHGVDSFHKTILYVFDNEAEMNAKEAELVTEEFCLREDTYNLCVGGVGGFSYINREGLRGCHTEKVNAKRSATAKRKGVGPGPANRLAVERAHREGKVPHANFKGRQHTAETKAKISAARKARANNGPVA